MEQFSYGKLMTKGNILALVFLYHPLIFKWRMELPKIQNGIQNVLYLEGEKQPALEYCTTALKRWDNTWVQLLLLKYNHLVRHHSPQQTSCPFWLWNKIILTFNLTPLLSSIDAHCLSVQTGVLRPSACTTDPVPWALPARSPQLCPSLPLVAASK